jgi:hypothetical protein
LNVIFTKSDAPSRDLNSALAMRDEARETLEDEIEVDAYMLDLRLKWFL